MVGLLEKTVGELLDDAASIFPEHEALIDVPSGRRYSYRILLETVNRLAKGLLKLGLKRGDHVALWAPNLPEWIITQFAVAKIGAILISVDPNCQFQQLDYLLKQSDSQSLIMTMGQKGSEHLAMIDELCPEIRDSIPARLNCRILPSLKNLILMSAQVHPGMFNWEELLEAGRDLPDSVLAERKQSWRADDIVTILYTSGTTGAPKGVMSTHFGIINASLASAENQRLTENDRLCLSVPLSHMFGCVCVVLPGVIKGASLVIPSEAFNAGKILEAIEKEHCTAIYGSPSAFIAMMENSRSKEISIRSLRTGIMGGAQCPMEVMKRVTEEMGVKEIVIGYGQTEASSWITATRPDDPLELRVSSVGRPLRNVEVKIIDPRTGEGVPIGGVGEICARGLNMKGYYKMPAATAHAIDSGGWLHTGDLGTMDEQGYVRTTGRLKEVIRKQGEAIYPAEIEEVLFSHPKILNAQVFGVPDQAMGEEVAAWIKLEEGALVTEDDVLQFCRERLSNLHVPRYLKFVSEFPTTPLGKVQKFKMREIAIKEYGLE